MNATPSQPPVNQAPVNQAMVWSNDEIAQRLETIADLLEAQEANPYRVRAYRQAATTLRELKQPAREILDKEGIEGLRRLPTIGVSLARAIEQLVQTGKIGLLSQLQGETAPEQVLATVPGIGPVLAERIHEQLGIESLPELEAAAYDGRLAQVPGFGAGRLQAVREVLAGRLHRRRRPRDRARPQPPADQPPVSELLAVDHEYRDKAQAKRLPTIAPRRFNPTGQAWLPILHTERDSTHYTALFSNTARAHELGTTHDWVVIYRDDQNGAGQWTVVTARFGPLQGKRIVRGREEECVAFYQQDDK
jgi:DNA polymerase (family X)